MNFSIKGVSLISWAFIALTVSSGFLLIVSTYNYVSYYPALAQLQLSTSKVSLQGSNSTGYHILLQVSMANPSGDSGFTLRDLSVRFFFTNTTSSTNSTDYLYRPISFTGTSQQQKPLGAHSTYTFPIAVSLSSADAMSVIDFDHMYPGNVTANVSSVAEIVTFLQPVTGRISVQSVDNVPLS